MSLERTIATSLFMPILHLFKGKKTTVDPMSNYTPEQLEIAQALQGLTATGTGGGLTLGELYGGDMGYYQQTPGELEALAGLQGMVGGQDISGARDTFSRMAGHKFDPDDPSSGYAAFSRSLDKAGLASADVLNREAAITGSRFGTGIQRQKAELASDLANQRGMFLADLYSRGEDRAMQGAAGLQSLVGTQQNLFRELASQSAIDRILKDEKAKNEYSDFKRGREEQMKRLGLMKDQFNAPMGSYDVKQPSMFSQLLPTIGSAIGSVVPGVGTAIGGILGSLGKGLFSKGTQAASSITPASSRLLRLYESGDFNPSFG